MNGILIANFTTLFKREIWLYAIGDIKLSKPISLRKALYIIAFGAIWLPLIYFIFGIHLNVFYLIFAIAPPLILGNTAGKPIWGGMSLLGWLITQFHYLKAAPVYTDLEPNTPVKTLKELNHEIWVSRRREMRYLAKQLTS